MSIILPIYLYYRNIVAQESMDITSSKPYEKSMSKQEF